jgi:arsenite methyltransferase
MHDSEDIKRAVRDRYAGHAAQATSCCSPGCGCGDAATVSREVGYSAEQLAQIPDGADLGLGCGNPLAMMELREGETVLDLGSGGGIDCFLAAKRVGETGRVIGVDMTPEMIARARRNAAEGGYTNVEFRLGEVEHLPVADGTVDAIISNCVINLVPDKRAAFEEAFRVLKPGGRLSVSDIVLLGEVPVAIADSVEAYVACLSGAILRDDYLGMMREAGFDDVRVTSEQSFAAEDLVTTELLDELSAFASIDTETLREAAALFQSVRVEARRQG